MKGWFRELENIPERLRLGRREVRQIAVLDRQLTAVFVVVAAGRPVPTVRLTTRILPHLKAAIVSTPAIAPASHRHRCAGRCP